MSNVRITPDHIAGKCARTDYFRVSERTTVCVLTLTNGFEVIGTSACVDPANYDQAIGERIACENAVAKIWELEGYLLKEMTHQAGHSEFTS